MRWAGAAVLVGTQVVAAAAAPVDGGDMLRDEVRGVMASAALAWFERHLVEVRSWGSGRAAAPVSAAPPPLSARWRVQNRDAAAHAADWLRLGIDVAAYNARVADVGAQDGGTRVLAGELRREMDEAGRTIAALDERYRTLRGRAGAAREAAETGARGLESVTAQDRRWTEQTRARVQAAGDELVSTQVRLQAREGRLRDDEAGQREAVAAFNRALDAGSSEDERAALARQRVRLEQRGRALSTEHEALEQAASRLQARAAQFEAEREAAEAEAARRGWARAGRADALARARREARSAEAAARSAAEALEAALRDRSERFGPDPDRFAESLARWGEGHDPSGWFDAEDRPRFDPGASEVDRWYAALRGEHERAERRRALERDRTRLVRNREALESWRRTHDARRAALGEETRREEAARWERVRTLLAELDSPVPGGAGPGAAARRRLAAARGRLTELEVRGWLAALTGDSPEVTEYASAAGAWSRSVVRAAAVAGIEPRAAWHAPDALTETLRRGEFAPPMRRAGSEAEVRSALAEWFEAMRGRGELDVLLDRLTTLTGRSREHLVEAVRALFVEALAPRVSIASAGKAGVAHLVGVGGRAFALDRQWGPVDASDPAAVGPGGARAAGQETDDGARARPPAGRDGPAGRGRLPGGG